MKLIRLGAAVLCCALPTPAWALAPRVAIPPAADVAGKDSGEALTREARRALLVEGVPLIAGPDLVKASRRARVRLIKGLKPEAAGRLAQRADLFGVVLFRRASAGAFADLIDAGGQVLLERLIHLKNGEPIAREITNFASAVAEAAGISAPEPPKPGPAESLPLPPPPTAAHRPAKPASEASDISSVYAGPELSATTPTPLPRSPLIRLSVGATLNTRLFLVPVFTYRTHFPYEGISLAGEAFPFKHFGLGLLASGAVGFVRAQFQGSTGTFTSRDTRADFDLAYRFFLGSHPYLPSLLLKAGFGLRELDAPSGSGLSDDDRKFGEFGLLVQQPLIPHYLHLALAATYLPFAKLGGIDQSRFGTSTAWGFEWSAELGGDLVSGLEWALQADQQRFQDTYSGPPSAIFGEASTSGIEIYTSYMLMLRFHVG